MTGGLIPRLMLVATLIVAGCRPDGPSFNSTDITGASFAREFSLTDHHGERRSLADFKGKVLVVFFGFTQCPDVCPGTLLQYKQVLEALEPAEASDVQMAFITVDPERDTQEVLSQYVPAFDERFLGLRGTPDEISAVTREFKVFFMKVPGSSPENYSIDHTAASYVFDRDGKVRLMVKHAAPIDTIVHDLRQLL